MDQIKKVFNGIRIAVACVGLVVASPFIVAYALITGRSFELDIE